MSDAQEDKPEEIEARMLAGLKRALSTKPQPHKPREYSDEPKEGERAARLTK